MAVNPTPTPPVIVPTPTAGLGYGGREYSYSPYGHGKFPRPPYPPGGGYGGAPYGHASYGSIDITPPRVTGLNSIDPYTFEVFFSEEMFVDVIFCDPANYVITPLIGAPATATLVLAGTPGANGGATSAIVSHTGTTLGGNYLMEVFNVTDLSGNAVDLLPTNTATALAFGDTPDYTVTPTSGSSLDVQFYRSDFSQTLSMVPESTFSPGIEDLNAYGISTTYPISMVIENVTHPGTGSDDSIASLDVSSMTSAVYDMEIAPSISVDYDGTILPSASVDFTGSETGTGTSSAGVSGLLLSKSSGVSYGWGFFDTSSRVLPSSTFRVDVDFDITAATSLTPALYDTTFATMTVSDGVVGVTLTLFRLGGTDMIQIDSGGLTQLVTTDWSSGAKQLTLLRNQISDHYSVLVDGTPIFTAVTASFTGVPSHAAGVQFVLSPSYALVDFPITNVYFTSTQTVFSTAWNFMHSVGNSFTGSAANAREFILTERGPLVKGWGDATPATKQDVAVRVNGTTVEVRDVNPYVGKVFPTIPIPLGEVGVNTIEVDYKWFPSPIMAMAGLNTEGLILNKWDQPNGHHEPAASPTPSSSLGAIDTARFPMGVALGCVVRTSPIRIGHRYIGYERAYTASLNSPTTLLLNQSPHRVSKQGFQKVPEAVVVSYEADTLPIAATSPWALSGTDTGSLDEAASTYTLIDAEAGSFDAGEAGFYFREENLSCPSTVNIATRLVVDNYTTDGVFTGVAFGFHDNFRLYLGGFLEINGKKHVGLLTNPSKPHLVDSWEIGPSVTATIIDETTFIVPTEDFPSVIDEDACFQVLDGPQAGIYQLAECGVVHGTDGTTTVTLDSSTPFPADPGLYGNDTAEVIFETLWDQTLTTYRLIADPDTKTVEFYVGGSLSGVVASISPVPSFPAFTSLKLNPTEEGLGKVFWGSVSRIATNESTWTFNRYSITPDQASFNASGIVVAAEMSDLPTEDSNNEWYLTNEFGQGFIDSSGDTLALKSTSGSPSAVTEETYGYGRVEPFLTATAAVDVDATFRVDTGTLGRDAQIEILDSTRQVLFSTILFEENGGVFELVSLPEQSLSGLLSPENDGWSSTGYGGSGTNELVSSVQQNLLTIGQALGTSGEWGISLAPTSQSGDDRLMEARLAVVSYAANTLGDIGFFFSATSSTGAVGKRITMSLRAAVGANAPKVVLSTDPNTPVAEFDFDWTDGEQHSYRLLIEQGSDSVSVVVDDTVLGTVAHSLFTDTGALDYSIILGAFATDTEFSVELDSLSVSHLPLPTARRTIGVFRGTDLDDINHWELPRTDTTTAANSDASNAVIEDMDWTSDISVRVRKDPGWGVTVYRPDLPLPPYYDPDSYATDITNPSEGWINVEYPRLPRVTGVLGQVRFGALDPRSVTQQRWSEVRYRIYAHASEDFLAPQGMVLNRFNVITSGEYNEDVTPEVVTVPTVTPTIISLTPSHIYADRVFNVLVEGTVYGPSAFTFDESIQTIFLSSATVPVGVDATVTFAPGKPITNTYLKAQPVLDSITLLNDGTPPVPKDQTADATREEVFGSQINDPNDTLNDDPDFILNDPFRLIQFTAGENSLYDCMEFCEVDDGGDRGFISIACDGPAPEHGLVELAFEGPAYYDGPSVPHGPGGIWGSSSPSIGGTASSFDTTKSLIISGGSYTDGNLGGGGFPGGLFVMYPNAGSSNAVQGSDAIQPLNQETKMVLTLSSSDSPYEDDLDLVNTMSDDVPPSEVGDAASNPNGTASTFGTGAAVYEVSDIGDANSVIGPWAGLAALETQSLMAGGGYPPSGMALTLNQPLTDPVVTSGVLEAANP